MIKNLKQIWNKWCVKGIHWPYLFDPTTEKPSITLLMLYVSSLIMFSSLIFLHFKDGILTATLTTILVWTLAYVFYRLRRLDKFKIDLDNKEIELSSAENSDEKEENES